MEEIEREKAFLTRAASIIKRKWVDAEYMYGILSIFGQFKKADLIEISQRILELDGFEIVKQIRKKRKGRG